MFTRITQRMLVPVATIWDIRRKPSEAAERSLIAYGHNPRRNQ